MNQSSDPTITLIKNIFEIMLSGFSAGDANAVTEHIEFPALGINSPTTAFNSKEEFIDFFNSYPLQEDYSYSKSDRMDIYPIGGPIYCLDYDYSRFNHNDEILSQGRGIYLFSNESGDWKVFSFWNGDKE